MSTQYETQGYTINNAGRRLVVDPITRIEGHMRCEVNINDQNVITNAVSCGTMFRGLEIMRRLYWRTRPGFGLRHRRFYRY